jgi:hypothetical protein
MLGASIVGALLAVACTEPEPRSPPRPATVAPTAGTRHPDSRVGPYLCRTADRIRFDAIASIPEEALAARLRFPGDTPAGSVAFRREGTRLEVQIEWTTDAARSAHTTLEVSPGPDEEPPSGAVISTVGDLALVRICTSDRGCVASLARGRDGHVRELRLIEPLDCFAVERPGGGVAVISSTTHLFDAAGEPIARTDPRDVLYNAVALYPDGIGAIHLPPEAEHPNDVFFLEAAARADRPVELRVSMTDGSERRVRIALGTALRRACDSERSRSAELDIALPGLSPRARSNPGNRVVLRLLTDGSGCFVRMHHSFNGSLNDVALYLVAAPDGSMRGVIDTDDEYRRIECPPLAM